MLNKIMELTLKITVMAIRWILVVVIYMMITKGLTFVYQLTKSVVLKVFNK